ncbi:carbon-nitrogen hydrolase family protein [Hydrogenophaga sp. A37]|uniref:carbon-nitrogen hydrolase family protein n=1 Tax=Hydrogenophaga sp. A37 TaxID=1945864 RepID=UPI000984A9B8|nr:carbon-nitrogen hydrolase family protein [Hydrogenophaga sp. A37]OOG79024.1 hypothetical protein B0E41_25800 [Hydrogenophaga sp. A37]
MPLLRIAAAQSSSVPGDVRENLRRHMPFVRAAAAEGVSLLLFPELSLTGYEPPLLPHHLLSPDGPVLAPMRELARRHRMTVIVGAPVRPIAGSKPAIGAICLYPDGSGATYRKRFLHTGEEAFASPGDVDTHCMDLTTERVSLAICADTVHAEHPRWAREAGATVYVAGVLWSRAGYAADAALMQAHAAEHGMAALVANHSSPTGGYASAGMSAFWKPGGALAITAPPTGDHLVVAELRHGAWSGTCMEVPPPAD